MEREPLDEVVSSLRGQIEGKLVGQDFEWLRLEDQPRELKFAPLGLAREILKHCSLTRLFRALSNDETQVNNDISAFNETEMFRILAILLCIPCSRDVLLVFRDKIIRKVSGFSISDNNLPIDEDKACQLFDGIGWQFYSKQFDFCPVVLEENKKAECTGKALGHRLPFLSPVVRLGEGSSGNVYKVEVPPNHFKFERESHGTNKEIEAFACKVFKTNDPRPFEKELEILDFIRRSLQQHPNVLLAVGSLLVQTTCILYFKVADGNLHDYFLKELEFPKLAKEIELFLYRFHGILDALAFLNEDLKTPENPTHEWRFAHLDLRPANILRFGAPTGEIWKLHDFGISKVKKATRVDEVTGWRKMFRSDAGDLTASATLMDPRSTTFMAPEHETGTGSEMIKTTHKSDIWSFGCIMSIGLSFLINGSHSVKEFSEKRQSQAGENDKFFVSERKFLRKERKVLNPAVSDYLGQVQRHNNIQNDAKLTSVFQTLIQFLTRRILDPDPKDRIKAKEGSKQLKEILRRLDCSETQASQNDNEFENWTTSLLRRVVPSSSVDSTDSPKTVELIPPEEPSSCKFSYCGKYLAYFSAGSIALYETTLVFRGYYRPTNGIGEPRLFKPPAGVKWRGFDINSKYLVAYTDANYFDCCIYTLSAQEYPAGPILSVDHKRFSIDALHSIYYAVLSQDSASNRLATVLKLRDKKYHIYLGWIENMISTTTTSTPLDPSHHTDQRPSISTSLLGSSDEPPQTASNSSSDNQSLPPLPWGNYHLHPEVAKNSGLPHIHSIQFSADSTILTVLSQPPKDNILTWYYWDTTCTRKMCIGKYSRKLDAKSDTHQVWMTSFIPLMPNPSVMFVTHQNTLQRRAFPTADVSANWSTQKLTTPIFHILPFDKAKDEHLIFIGSKKGTVSALYAAESRSKEFAKAEKIEFDYILDLECQDWNVEKDSAACLQVDMEFLIAKPPKGGKMAFVRKVYRPTAPRRTNRQ